MSRSLGATGPRPRPVASLLLAVAWLAALFVSTLSAGAGARVRAVQATPEGRTPEARGRDAREVTVYLLRHAEKVDEGDASGLTEAGQARARALAELLAGEPVALVLSSQFARTRLTVEPVAEKHGLRVEEISAHDYPAFVARIRSLAPGSAAVVCGHSNTVPVIASQLGVEEPPVEAEVAYGDLYVVRVPAGRVEKERRGNGRAWGGAAAFERRRYGDP
jgi:phosphohistidine phosphatase SixA